MGKGEGVVIQNRMATVNTVCMWTNIVPIQCTKVIASNHCIKTRLKKGICAEMWHFQGMKTGTGIYSSRLG